MKRRDILKNSALLMGSSILPTPLLGASFYDIESDPKFFVMMETFGGMDCTLGLDPWVLPKRPLETDLFIEYSNSEVFKNVGGTDIHLGPAAEPLKPFARDMAIINGIILSEVDNGHEASARYVRRGKGDGQAPDLPVEIGLSSQLGRLGITAESSLYTYNRNVASTQIKEIEYSRTLDDPSLIFEDSTKSNPTHTALHESKMRLIDSRGYYSNIFKKLEEMERDLNGQPLLPQHILVASFLSGGARQGIIDAGRQFSMDTHSLHIRNHIQLQKRVWGEVVKILNLFKSTPFKNGSLFDYTTFFVTTEFSRTPYLNGSQGKDHNPMTNSLLLIGNGVKGGSVVGGSKSIGKSITPTGTPYHMGRAIDYKTGVFVDKVGHGDFIYPENVAITVAKAAGADLRRFGSVDRKTKVLPLVV